MKHETNMRRIRICHLANNLTGRADGVYAHLKMLFTLVGGDEFEHFLVFPGNPAIEEETRRLDVRVRAFPDFDRRFPFMFMTEFMRYVRENDIDILHAHTLKPYAVIGMTNALLRRKAIFNYHGLFITSEYYGFLETMAYRASHLISALAGSIDLVVVPSRRAQESLLSESKRFPVMETYYNGCPLRGDEAEDPSIVALLEDLGARGPVVAMIGRFEHEKRFDRALRIAARVVRERRTVQFVFFGEGPLQKRLREETAALGLGDNVTVGGYVAGAARYLHRVDVLMITSDREGMPLSMWEAMAAGIPVLSTDVGGVKEILEPERCGLTFDRANEDAGARALLRLLADERLRSAMGMAGREAIAVRFTPEAFALKFADVYRQLMRGRVSGAEGRQQ